MCQPRFGASSGLTAQQQRELIDTAERKAAASVGLAALDCGAAVAPPAVRVNPLGRDRSGATFWDLACSPALAGAPALNVKKNTKNKEFSRKKILKDPFHPGGYAERHILWPLLDSNTV